MATALDKRNKQIFMDKYGYNNMKERKITKEPETYRALMIKYNLSLKRIQDIIAREKLRLLESQEM